jgi:hypothetical protein
MLFGTLIFPCFAAEIMTKFSARFDAKAAKDAKGKGKVNPPSTLSQGVAKTAAGSDPGVGVKATSTARGSPFAGKLLLLQELRREEKSAKARGRGLPKVTITSCLSNLPKLSFCFSFISYFWNVVCS